MSVAERNTNGVFLMSGNENSFGNIFTGKNFVLINSYLDRGRAFHDLSDAELDAMLLAALQSFQKIGLLPITPECLRTKDVCCEYALRKIAIPPDLTKRQVDALIATGSAGYSGPSNLRFNALNHGIVDDCLDVTRETA